MPELSLPLVCVCVPTYNADSTISATLNSILGQSYPNLSVLVVDNCSTDNTVAIVRSFDDPRITLHRNETNLGGEGNFNRCIELAAGKYMAIYHADDIYEPEMVAMQVNFLQSHPQAGAVFTEAILIDESGQRIGEMRQPSALARSGPMHAFSALFKAVLEHSNFLICPSVMALTSVYQQDIKGWRGEMFGSSADLDVWLRMAQRGPIGILPHPAMRYRISNAQWSARVRLDTRRAAFFGVVDHYLAIQAVRQMLSPRDLVNYERLERRDRVMRAINALLQDRVELAAELCPDVFSVAAIGAALTTRRGLAVLMLSAWLKSSLFFNMQGLAKVSFRYLKKATSK